MSRQSDLQSLTLETWVRGDTTMAVRTTIPYIMHWDMRARASAVVAHGGCWAGGVFSHRRHLAAQPAADVSEPVGSCLDSFAPVGPIDSEGADHQAPATAPVEGLARGPRPSPQTCKPLSRQGEPEASDSWTASRHLPRRSRHRRRYRAWPRRRRPLLLGHQL